MKPSALADAARIRLQTLLYIERGVTAPHARTLAKLATALRCTVDEFFARKNAA